MATEGNEIREIAEEETEDSVSGEYFVKPS